jgi:hypothetical protein
MQVKDKLFFFTGAGKRYGEGWGCFDKHASLVCFPGISARYYQLILILSIHFILLWRHNNIRPPCSDAYIGRGKDLET